MYAFNKGHILKVKVKDDVYLKYNSLLLWKDFMKLHTNDFHCPRMCHSLESGFLQVKAFMVGMC